MVGLEIIHRSMHLRRPRYRRLAVGSLTVLTLVTWMLGLGLLAVGPGG